LRHPEKRRKERRGDAARGESSRPRKRRGKKKPRTTYGKRGRSRRGEERKEAVRFPQTQEKGAGFLRRSGRNRRKKREQRGFERAEEIGSIGFAVAEKKEKKKHPRVIHKKPHQFTYCGESQERS